ncbi:MAG: 30S ribosomal protein S18 [Patescibacteria group bacterium]
MMRKKKIIYKSNKKCGFCEAKIEPDFKDVATLSKYLSERGRILGHERTGICSKHQRRLAKSLKQARHMALLPFVAGL